MYTLLYIYFLNIYTVLDLFKGKLRVFQQFLAYFIIKTMDKDH